MSTPQLSCRNGPRARPIALLLAAVLLGGNAYAQNTPHASSATAAPIPHVVRSALSPAVDSAWQRAIEPREADALRRSAAAGRTVAASTWAAPPSVELGRRQTLSGGGHETEAGLVLPLWHGGQRQARVAVADGEERLAQVTELAGRFKLAAQVVEAGWRVAADQAHVLAMQGQLALVTRVANDVQRRVGAGDLARTDALSVQAELADIQQGTQEAAQRLLESRAAWRLLTGLDDIPTLTGTTQPMGNDNALPHPEVQLAELTVEHQRNRLAVVSGEARDPTELKVQVSNEGGGGRPSQNTIGVSVRIPLGAQSRNSLPEVAASSALELSRTALMRTRMQVEASQRLSQQSLTAAEAQLATSQRRVDLLRERGTLVRRAFDAGEFALPELLRALASLSQAEAAHARHATALGLAQARFQLSHGVSP